MFSDHRPVFGTFQCTITAIDEKTKDAISEQLYNKRRAVVGDDTANTRAADTDEEDLMGYESVQAGFPPASSDKRKWWLDGGMYRHTCSRYTKLTVARSPSTVSSQVSRQ